MKKRILILLLVAVLAVCSLCGCTIQTYSNPVDEAANETSQFVVIDGKNYLSYSKDTSVVYYMFSTNKSVGNRGYGYTYFAPYISENGNFCKYVDGQIVEITSQTPSTNN